MQPKAVLLRSQTELEFLKSRQLLQPGATALVLDENGALREWPPARLASHEAHSSQSGSAGQYYQRFRYMLRQ